VGLPIIKSPEPWVTVTGKLLDSKTEEPLAAKIIYERLPDGKDLGISQSEPKTGEYEILLPGGHLYGVRAEAKDYLSETQTLDLRDITSDTKITNKNFTLKPIQVVPIEQDAVMRLNTIFFDFGKAVLKPEAFPELERVVQVMSERPDMHIEIAGHTDNVGSEQMNQKLSERRALAVKKFMLSKGIDVSRITAVGYGEKVPIVSNDDEKDGREINRRVEIKIVKL
jgi:outer membrane protein OmpA-like peptidoglycan-associated protein